MIRLDLHTLPRDFSSLQLDAIQKKELPAFATYTPDYQALYTLAGQYARINNFIIIGRGGSVTGFKSLFHGLARYHTTKNIHIIDGLDCEQQAYIRKKCLPDDTLVIAISKSGNTVDVIENLLCFDDYQKMVVTENPEGALAQIAEVKGLHVVKHPPIGGRFSTGTESALLPGALIYVDVKSFVNGLERVYQQCAPSKGIEENPALQLAAAMYLAEQQGFTEVYAPVYSKPLSGSMELWTQLMHESVCKKGKGQTFLFMEAPECQHHTNQKFFDGPRRMMGLFTLLEQHNEPCVFSLGSGLSGLHIKDLPLTALEGEQMGQALFHEYTGVRKAADDAKIPTATITIDTLNPSTLGELNAFWMYVAVYSSWLRGVDAFDQPGVEASKKHAIEQRKRRP
jgi:glucose-6-phosphate isomerase